MAGFSGDYKQRVSSALIQCLKIDQQLLVAESLIKQNGLQWSSPNSSDVFIIGPHKDVVEFAVECLESLLDKNRNPLCSLKNRETRLVFKDTLAKNIIKSQQILEEISLHVLVYENEYSSDVTVSCNYADYSKIRKTIDQIRYSTSSSTDSSSVLDKNVVEGKRKYNGYPGSPSTPLIHFQGSKFQYSFKAKNIHVYVYKASITDVKGIDAIVNAADEYLRHESGVAYAICEAAGHLVKKQCSEYFIKYGRIPIGKNCVTIPGNLKYLKTIIHAVGPRWDDYLDKKQCAMALHETIINVLMTANTRCVQKIALPPISAGIFKVPKDLCAQIYIKAIMDYSRDVKPNNVTEIHFVDIKDDILKEIRKAHENWMKSPELLDFKNLDFKNALGYAPPQGGARARTPSYSDRQGQGHHGSASYLPCEVQYSGTETMTSGVQQTIFKVEKNVTVRIYSGSIVKVSGVDALVCSVGSGLKGGKLAEVFESTGGEVYKKALSNLKRLPHLVGDVAVLLESGNLRSKFVLLAIMESEKIMTVDENTAQKLKDLYVKILETASAIGMKKIALTLLGSGMLVNDVRNLECCCNSLFDGLTNSRVVRGICVEDIQVVNFHQEVTDAIVRVFRHRSTRSQAKSKIKGGVVGESKSSSESIPKPKKPGIPIRPPQSPKIPNDYKKRGGKTEQEKYASVDVHSSPWFSHDKDNSYNQVHGNGLKWNDKNEVKQKERAQYSSSSSLSSQDEEDADNFEQNPNEKLHQKQTRGNQPVVGDGVSWMETGNSGKAQNLPIYDIEADKLKTVNTFKIEKSVETCSSDTCDRTAKEALDCGHKFCEICFIPMMKRNPVCTICSQKSSEVTLGASSTNHGKITKMPDKLKTVNKLTIEKSVETCSSNTCDRTAKEALDCGHKFCEICFIPMKRNPVCTICLQKSFEITLGASSTNHGKITKMPEVSSSIDTCILCKEKLDTRQKLPCGHVICKQSSQKPVDDAKVKNKNEKLTKNTGVSVTTSGEKDTEINKLEKILNDLEAKKIEMIKEMRKKELEEKIRQAEEDLRGLSAGTKQEQSNKSTPPLSSLSIERDREEIELEQKLTELKEKKLSVLKERNKQELKEKIKQLEKDLSTKEADIQEEVKRCLFCSDGLRNPKKLGCGHEFCSKCFYQAFEFQEGCPVCGIKVGDDDDSQQELSSDALHSWYNSSDFIENS